MSRRRYFHMSLIRIWIHSPNFLPFTKGETDVVLPKYVFRRIFFRRHAWNYCRPLLPLPQQQAPRPREQQGQAVNGHSIWDMPRIPPKLKKSMPFAVAWTSSPAPPDPILWSTPAWPGSHEGWWQRPRKKDRRGARWEGCTSGSWSVSGFPLKKLNINCLNLNFGNSYSDLSQNFAIKCLKF